MTLKEFLEKIYSGNYVIVYLDGRATVSGTTRQVLKYVHQRQLDKQIKGIAPFNGETIEIAI